MPFCLYTIANGSLAIFENGGSTFINVGTYAVGDVLSISYIDGVLTYKKNNVALGNTPRSVSPSPTLYLCCTAGIANAKYKANQFRALLAGNSVDISKLARIATIRADGLINVVLTRKQRRN